MRSHDFFITSTRPSAKKARIACILHTPDAFKAGESSPIPCLIMCGGIGTVNSRVHHLAPIADEFTSAGFACLTFDYISFGASDGTPRNVLSVGHELQDVRDVVAWARGQPEQFDARKLVLWGSSFGGMYVASLLAQDHGFAAGIAQCPLVDGLKATLQIPVSRAAKLALLGVMDVVKSVVLRGEPVYVPLYSGGDRTALMEGRHVVQGMETIFGDELNDYPNYVAARIGLTLMLHRPVTRVSKSKTPLLIVAPEWDGEASLSAAKLAAEKAPKGHLLRVKGGHFDLYFNGPGYQKNIVGQLKFLGKMFGDVA